MTKLPTHQLQSKIPQDVFDYTLLTDALSSYSGVRQKIHELIRASVIIRVKKGLYVFGPKYTRAPIQKEVLANLIYGPSYISLEYALSFHGLIPERVETLTSVTSKKDKIFNTPLGQFTYRYLNLKKYTCGIELVQLNHTQSILIASVEKSLCDYMALNPIPLFSNYHEAGEYLNDGLRIDQKHWSRFKINNLKKLNKIFLNKNIALVISAFEKFKKI